MKRRKLMTPTNIGLLFEHCDDDAIRPYAETKMLVRLYFAAVHDRMLLPGTTSYLGEGQNLYEIVFADCIEKNPVERELSGRIKHYTDEILRGFSNIRVGNGSLGGKKL